MKIQELERLKLNTRNLKIKELIGQGNIEIDIADGKQKKFGKYSFCETGL